MKSKFEESICSCYACKKACKERPCWPTPKETQALIDKGFGARLMRDYWVGDGPNGEDIKIVSPAIVDNEHDNAPLLPFGRCTFLNANDLCELHDLGLKPFEGRVSSCKSSHNGLHEFVAKTWNCVEGLQLVKKWTEEFLE